MNPDEVVHFGRSFVGTFIESTCPCTKAPCGLVENISQLCPEHPMKKAKTIRQMHLAKDCPGRKTDV